MGVIRSSELEWIKEGFTEVIFQLKLERLIGFSRHRRRTECFRQKKQHVQSHKAPGPGESREELKCRVRVQG